MKKFLFKPSKLKDILRELIILPGLLIGFSIGELIRDVQRFPMWICIAGILFGVIYSAWAIVYIWLKYSPPKFDNKGQLTEY